MSEDDLFVKDIFKGEQVHSIDRLARLPVRPPACLPACLLALHFVPDGRRRRWEFVTPVSPRSPFERGRQLTIGEQREVERERERMSARKLL